MRQRESKFFAGQGSARVFRENFFKRLAAVFYNLAFYREHGPPHFHAVYREFEAVVDIETGWRHIG